MALFHQISEVIWDEILSGRVKVGEKLKDTDWAARTGASRTPVREALRELVRDGVLVQRTSGGFELKTMSGDELLDLYDFRATLEGLALKSAIVSKGAVDIEKLKECVTSAMKHYKGRDYEGVLQCNTDFHRVLIENSTNSFANNAIAAAHRLVMFARRTVLNQTSLAMASTYEASLKRDHQDHESIINQLEIGDVDAAAITLEAHVRRTGRDMAEMIQVP